MRLDVDPGTEKYVPWARRLLGRLTGLRLDLGLPAMTKVYAPESGTLVYVHSAEAADFVRITGAPPVFSVAGFGNPYPQRGINFLISGDGAPSLVVTSSSTASVTTANILNYTAFGHVPVYEIITTTDITYETRTNLGALAHTYTGQFVSSNAGSQTLTNWPVQFAYTSAGVNYGVALTTPQPGPMGGMPSGTFWAAASGVAPGPYSYTSLGYEALTAGLDPLPRVNVVATDGTLLLKGPLEGNTSTGPGYGIYTVPGYPARTGVLTDKASAGYGTWYGGGYIDYLFQSSDVTALPAYSSRNTFAVPSDCVWPSTGSYIHYCDPLSLETLALWNLANQAAGGQAITIHTAPVAGITYTLARSLAGIGPDFGPNNLFGAFVSDGTNAQLLTKLFSAWDLYAASPHYRLGDGPVHPFVSQGVRDWATSQQAFADRRKAKLKGDSDALVASFKAGAPIPILWANQLRVQAPGTRYAHRASGVTAAVSDAVLSDTSAGLSVAGTMVVQRTADLSFTRTGMAQTAVDAYRAALPATLTSVQTAPDAVTVSQHIVGTVTVVCTVYDDAYGNIGVRRIMSYTYNNWHADGRTGLSGTRDPLQYPSLVRFVASNLYLDSPILADHSALTPQQSMLVLTGVCVPEGRPVSDSAFDGANSIPTAFENFALLVPPAPPESYVITGTMPDVVKQFRAAIPTVYDPPPPTLDPLGNPLYGPPTFDPKLYEWSDSMLYPTTKVKIALLGQVTPTGESLGVFGEYAPVSDLTTAELYGAVTYSYSYVTGEFAFASWHDADPVTGSKIISTPDAPGFFGSTKSTAFVVQWYGKNWPDIVANDKSARTQFDVSDAAFAKAVLAV